VRIDTDANFLLDRETVIASVESRLAEHREKSLSENPPVEPIGIREANDADSPENLPENPDNQLDD